MQCSGGPGALVPDPEERVRAGHGVAEEAEVLGRHQGLRLDHETAAEHCAGGGPHEGGHDGVVDGGWVVGLLAFPPVDGRAAAVCACDAVGDLLQAPAQLLHGRVVERSAGSKGGGVELSFHERMWICLRLWICWQLWDGDLQSRNRK